MATLSAQHKVLEQNIFWSTINTKKKQVIFLYCDLYPRLYPSVVDCLDAETTGEILHMLLERCQQFHWKIKLFNMR